MPKFHSPISFLIFLPCTSCTTCRLQLCHLDCHLTASRFCSWSVFGRPYSKLLAWPTPLRLFGLGECCVVYKWHMFLGIILHFLNNALNTSETTWKRKYSNCKFLRKYLSEGICRRKPSKTSIILWLGVWFYRTLKLSLSSKQNCQKVL